VLKGLLPILLLLSIAACSGYSAPVISRIQPPSIRIMTHQVATGDTLYSIAWRYDLNPRLLASANGLRDPFIIKPGQMLKLNTRGVKPVKAPPESRVTVAAAKESVVSKKTPVKVKNKPTQIVYSKGWQWKWPIEGKITEGFSPKDLRKGVTITGDSSAKVRPAAPGTVVYAGDGLRGYGNLVIIKHSDIFLSAYGHNEKIMVKAGQKVTGTEILSQIGKPGTLYFEIRKDGYPVNPVVYVK
jgi:lipoprotein NlpD